MIGRKATGSSFLAIAFVSLLALLLAPVVYASGDPFTAPSPGPGIIAIEGKWQFHLGDDLSWSKADFDDSAWEQLNADSYWGAQTRPGYTGFACYRKQIHLTGRPGKVAVLIPRVEDAYELFWNGQKIGEFGKLPPHGWRWATPRGVVYPLGTAPLDGVLALRVWEAPLTSTDVNEVGGFFAAPLLGSPAVLTQRITYLQQRHEDLMLPRFIFSGALFITGLIALLLFLRERREFLYLWLALFLIANGLTCLQGLNPVYYGLKSYQADWANAIISALQDISLWLLLLTLFGLHKQKTWKRWTIALAAIYLTAMVMDDVILSFWDSAGPAMQWGNAITSGLVSFLPIYLLFIVAFALIRRPQKALLPIALAATIYGIYNLALGASSQGIRFTHFTFPRYLNPAIPLGPYVFGIPAILNTMFFLVLLFTVARHQALERRRQTHIESEIKSAREIQHVLIPEEAPVIPGFVINSVYKPASEVGGDFLQVIPMLDPTNEPGALIILGDVSGKGLTAAMTVSLIVGTLRTLADFTQDPADILRGLNQRLLGRTQGGFTTCVAIRIDSTGRTVIANAGHLSPFCAGREIMLPGSLPLGLAAEADYESVSFDLEPDETLTFFTDGVLEARNAKGALYGFERLSSLMEAQPSVQQVVDAACSFGQEDDITVLSVKRVVDSELHHARLDFVAQIAVG
jgi:phosphoserine phosphatase RsbU/P